MNDRELRKIEWEHKAFKEKIENPYCPFCGQQMSSEEVVKEIAITDRWGGEVWGVDKPIPVWKCPNNHFVHFRNMSRLLFGYQDGRYG